MAIKSLSVPFAVVLLAAGALSASAGLVMPDFGAAPTGWTTDRYEPSSFGNVGTYEGRSSVLGIGISSAQGVSQRPSGQQGTFYNTQGKKHLISGGAGSILSADLWVDSDWGDASNGHIRTGMWGTMDDGSSITAYPILGFTNYGGAARFRVYDGDIGDWVNLTDTVQLGSWNALAMEFTGTSFDYYVNGNLAFSDNTVNGSTQFKEVIMQAYNFYDPAITDAIPVDYTAHWSNSMPAVPEPGSIAILGLGLLAVGCWRRRRK